MKTLTCLFIWMSWIGVAQAETIHRCTDAQGKVSYSATPCPQGASTAKKLEYKASPAAAPQGDSTVPEWKRQEAAFNARRESRLNEDYQQEQEAARVKQQEEISRKAMEESKLRAQQENARNAGARRYRQSLGFE